MPATTTRGLPYLLPSDPPDLAGATQNLANAVDNYFGNTLIRCMRLMTRTTSGSIANATYVPITAYPTTASNIGDITYSAGVLTVTTPGLYRWDTTAVFDTATGGRASLQVYVNGVRPDTRNGQNETALISGGTNLSAGGPLLLNANDGIQLYVYQSSGGALAVTPFLFSLARIA